MAGSTTLVTEVVIERSPSNMRRQEPDVRRQIFVKQLARIVNKMRRHSIPFYILLIADLATTVLGAYYYYSSKELPQSSVFVLGIFGLVVALIAEFLISDKPVDHLPEGLLPIYDKDFEATAKEMDFGGWLRSLKEGDVVNSYKINKLEYKNSGISVEFVFTPKPPFHNVKFVNLEDREEVQNDNLRSSSVSQK